MGEFIEYDRVAGTIQLNNHPFERLPPMEVHRHPLLLAFDARQRVYPYINICHLILHESRGDNIEHARPKDTHKVNAVPANKTGMFRSSPRADAVRHRFSTKNSATPAMSTKMIGIARTDPRH
ncbi:hypothetical protein GBF35_27365 [Nonomuraea phyllanthi]|uniref:hypothetical protein n=1 Tax=Nonomuraea phyllanthi TaxID=2219224 RepID=UPI0012934DDA|nr:hypothetical protein [Nonomuraea phyllanthi]QFY09875.1 hypothetical protein GBF35_27365 [Nonomuraea phyllanthi]